MFGLFTKIKKKVQKKYALSLNALRAKTGTPPTAQEIFEQNELPDRIANPVLAKRKRVDSDEPLPPIPPYPKWVDSFPSSFDGNVFNNPNYDDVPPISKDYGNPSIPEFNDTPADDNNKAEFGGGDFGGGGASGEWSSSPEPPDSSGSDSSQPDSGSSDSCSSSD